MKKHDFTKLALMGLASGSIIASQPFLTADEEKSESHSGNRMSLAQNSCGSHSPQRTYRLPFPGHFVTENDDAKQAVTNYSTNEETMTKNSGYMDDDGYYQQGEAPAGQKSKSQESSLSEEKLLSQLNNRGKALYRSLGEEGKALARRFASQSDKYKDKNDAVQAASDQIRAEKQTMKNSR